MKKVYYEKVGRKYVPVSEYDSILLESLPRGDHLIMCYPGGRSTRYKIDAAYAPLIAASRVAEEAVCSAIIQAQDLKPSSQPITEKQQKLWQELAASFKRDDYPLIRPAARDAAEAAAKALVAEAEKLMGNESVRRAYEQFLIVCELAKEESKGG